MLDLHLPTNDFLVAFYERATRYYSLTASLVSQGHLEYEDALVKIRMEIYGLHNQIWKLLQPLYRRLDRYDLQVKRALQVRFICF